MNTYLGFRRENLDGCDKRPMKIIDCSSDLTSVGADVAKGCVVVFPTDTVYGLGSNPLSVQGVSKCFELKQRDFGKHFPILFDSIESVERFVIMDDSTHEVAAKYWPGKLTMILPLQNISLPKLLIGDSNFLAVRIPKHECCKRLISKCGGSLIGTSANVSGKEPFIDPDDQGLSEFAKGADYFVKGKCGQDRISSTVIDFATPDTPKVVREGALPSEEVLDYFEKARRTARSSKIGTI